MTVTIQLTKGYTAIVDDCDADLAEFKWYYVRGYALRGRYPDHVWLHRIILQRMLNVTLRKEQLCDHVNGDKFDCRRNNLRIASHAENMRNQKHKVNSKSPHKGASWNKKASKWQCLIRIDKKPVWLGNFDTAIEAHLCYCIATLTYHKEFANFGEDSPFKDWTIDQLANVQSEIDKLPPIPGKWGREVVESMYEDYLSGMSQKQVAAKYNTVQTWVSQLFVRYGFKNRSQLKALTLGKAS